MFQRASSAAARASASLVVTYTARWTPTRSGGSGLTSATTRSNRRRNSAMRSIGTPKPPVSTLNPRRTAPSTASGLGAGVGDPDRRTRAAELREDRRLRDLEQLAVVGERLALEGLQNDVDGLFPAGAPPLPLEAEARGLVVLVAAAEADVDPSRRQGLERRDLLGHHQRMVQRHHEDRGAHGQAGGPRARGG